MTALQQCVLIPHRERKSPNKTSYEPWTRKKYSEHRLHVCLHPPCPKWNEKMLYNSVFTQRSDKTESRLVRHGFSQKTNLFFCHDSPEIPETWFQVSSISELWFISQQLTTWTVVYHLVHMMMHCSFFQHATLVACLILLALQTKLLYTHKSCDEQFLLNRNRDLCWQY